MNKSNNPAPGRSEKHARKLQPENEGNFELVEFADVPEPMVAAHIPMQED